MRVDRKALPGAAASAAAAVLAIGGLSLLARPGQADTRLAEVAAVAARAHQGAADLQPPLASPCRTSVSAAADEAQANLRAIAAQAGVRLEVMEFADLPTVTSDLRGLKVAVRLHGEEGAFTRFLREASKARMPIFLDAAEVRRTATGGLFVALDGRLLCRRGGR